MNTKWLIEQVKCTLHGIAILFTIAALLIVLFYVIKFSWFWWAVLGVGILYGSWGIGTLAREDLHK